MKKGETEKNAGLITAIEDIIKRLQAEHDKLTGSKEKQHCVNCVHWEIHSESEPCCQCICTSNKPNWVSKDSKIPAITIPVIGAVKDEKVTFYDDKTEKKLGEWQVGHEFTATNTTWKDMKCKFVRVDKEVFYSYEMIAMAIEDGSLSNKKLLEEYHESTEDGMRAIHCIDPRYWTKEVDGVLYRAYNDVDGNIRLYWKNKDNRYWTSDSFAIPTELITKTLNVLIMPFNYMGEDCGFEYPVEEES